MQNEIKAYRMNWGKWIIVAFVLFAVFIATLVTVCMREDVSLVSGNYYKEELAYSDQITRLNNAAKLAIKPVIRKEGNYVTIVFNRFTEVEEGELLLFRPSDSDMDKRFELTSSSENVQSFAIDNLEKGMYRARMRWVMEGDEFFIETILNL